MSEIAEVTMLPAATATRLIDDMAANNLVYRRTDDADRRRVLIFLSARGKDRYQRLLPIAAQEQSAVSALYNQKDMQELIRLLTKLMDRVG